jgi:hypothetical protein
MATGGDPRVATRPVLDRLARQLKAEVRAGRMRPMAPEQFVVNLISLCIFPFAARPMLGILLGMDDAAFARFIAARRTELPAFLRAGVQP